MPLSVVSAVGTEMSPDSPYCVGVAVTTVGANRINNTRKYLRNFNIYPLTDLIMENYSIANYAAKSKMILPDIYQ